MGQLQRATHKGASRWESHTALSTTTTRVPISRPIVFIEIAGCRVGQGRSGRECWSLSGATVVGLAQRAREVQGLTPDHLTHFELLSASRFISMADPNCADCDQQRPAPAIPAESPIDPATFVAPTVLASPRVVIEFCNRVRICNSFPRDIGRDSFL